MLYRVIQRHWGEFLAQVEAGDREGRLPAFVKQEFEAYLGCGLLARGCLHVRCEQCGDEMVVAFSCKENGRAPGGGGRGERAFQVPIPKTQECFRRRTSA